MNILNYKNLNYIIQIGFKLSHTRANALGPFIKGGVSARVHLRTRYLKIQTSQVNRLKK